MSIDGNQLIAALGSGVLPSGVERAGKEDAGALSFEEVLRRVHSGQPSQIGIEFGKSIDPSSVTKETQEQLGQAADAAVLKGINDAVVDLNGEIMRLDVVNRVLNAQITPGDIEVVDKIDGFVSLKAKSTTDTELDQPPQSGLSLPARIVRNSSLAEALSAHGL